MRERLLNHHPALILTLELDAAAMAAFEALRRRYFPPERNIVPAHVCLFHALPGGSSEETTQATVRRIAATCEQTRMTILGPRSIGRGVAVFFDATPLHGLHRELANAFSDELSAQDRQGFRPHVVVQNKVPSELARATLDEIAQQSLPRDASAIGVVLWRYLGGPWQELDRVFFGRSSLTA